METDDQLPSLRDPWTEPEPKLKVLFIAHNHPSLYPGGAEAYSLDVYHQMQSRDDIEPIFLARIGPTPSTHLKSHPGTPFGKFDFDSGQYWIYSDTADYDWLHLTVRQKGLFTFYLRDFLLAEQPDVVHLHHTLYLGPEILRVIRNVLPEAAIVFTLHDYRFICHRDGVMVRNRTEELCEQASPSRCNGCFSDVSPGAFFMRKRFFESHLDAVDVFLAPSEFLLQKYVEWGIPQQKIRFSEYGRPAVEMGPESPDRAPHNRIGYFGQLNPYKGIDVLLRAMQLLADDGVDVRLRVHGANLEWHGTKFRRRVSELAESAPNVTWVGRYDRKELRWLMPEIDWVVVPSLWWENSPLTIHEAFQYGKPVICSGIGALKEKVEDGVNGLHFRRGDPESLAHAIRDATSSDGLWQKLHAGIPKVKTIEEDVQSLVHMYREVLSSTVAR